MSETEEKTEIKDLNAVVAVPQDIRLKIISAEHALALAQEMTIEDADDLQFVVNERNSNLTNIKFLQTELDKVLNPTKLIVDTVRGWFRPGLTNAEAAVKHLNGLITGWTAKEQKRIEDANAAAKAEERRLRQEAEAKAAAAVAEAAERAREQTRIAEEAEANRKKALAIGDAEAAAAAAATAASATEKAVHAVEEGNAKAQEVTLQAAAIVAPTVLTAPAVAGNTMRKKWVAELAENTTAEQAKLKIITAIIKEERMDLLGLLDVDEKSLRKLAEGLETNMRVPGYVAVNRPIAASRK